MRCSPFRWRWSSGQRIPIQPSCPSRKTCWLRNEPSLQNGASAKRKPPLHTNGFAPEGRVRYSVFFSSFDTERQVMRTEKDSMGEMQVPASALYGASTQRAVLNFPISGHPMPDGFIRGLGLVKAACATANERLGKLDAEKADLIRRA